MSLFSSKAAGMNPIDEEKGFREDVPTAPFSDVDDEEADDSSSEDEDANLKQLRPAASQFSIRRNDSFNSFLTRSERAALLGKDKPPPPEEARKRRVKFHDDPTLETVHVIDKVGDEDKAQVYMNNDDFSRAETELKLTMFRWENHLAGTISFDEANNSMRGLEHLADRAKQNKIDLQKYKHNRAVLEEINRQKQDYGEVKDWEVVRKISQQFSVHSLNHAVEHGRKDREAYQKAWNTTTNNKESNNATDFGLVTKGREEKEERLVLLAKEKVMIQSRGRVKEFCTLSKLAATYRQYYII